MTKKAKFKNNESVDYDRVEFHDDKVLFFRDPIGLVYAQNIIEIDDNDPIHKLPHNDKG